MAFAQIRTLQLPAAQTRGPLAAVAPSQRASTCRLLRRQLTSLPGLGQGGRQAGRSAARPQHVTAAAGLVAAPNSTFWPAIVQAWSSNPAAVMLAAGACILGVSLSIFLLAAIPTMLAVRRSARAMESLLLVVQAEVSDTAATLRLSGLELADCIQEVGALSTDLTDGLRASARALSSAEQSLRQGAGMAGKAVTDYVLPQAKDKVEAALQERARLEYTAALIKESVQTTKATAQRLRVALAASRLAKGVLLSARQFGRGPRRGTAPRYEAC